MLCPLFDYYWEWICLLLTPQPPPVCMCVCVWFLIQVVKQGIRISLSLLMRVTRLVSRGLYPIIFNVMGGIFFSHALICTFSREESLRGVVEISSAHSGAVSSHLILVVGSPTSCWKHLCSPLLLDPYLDWPDARVVQHEDRGCWSWGLVPPTEEALGPRCGSALS